MISSRCDLSTCAHDGSMPNYENFCLNGKVPVNFYDRSNGYGVILNKFYLAAILEYGALQNSAIQLHHIHSYLWIFMLPKILHTSPSLKLPQDPVRSWAKPKTRILATIFPSFCPDSRVFITQMQMRYQTKLCTMLYENVRTLSYEKL